MVAAPRRFGSALLAAVLAASAIGCGSTTIDRASSTGTATPTVTTSGSTSTSSTGSTSSSTTSPPPTTCPTPSEPNAEAVVLEAAKRATWAEAVVSMLLDGEPATDAVAALVVAAGGQVLNKGGLVPQITAMVPNARVGEIPCWAHVTKLTGNAPVCAGSCVDDCIGKADCSGACAPLVGTRVDVQRGCATPAQVLDCASGIPATGEPLECWVKLATSEVFAVAAEFLDAHGHAVRPCTREEGGPTAPSELPACP
jgi:hypothetical protein